MNKSEVLDAIRALAAAGELSEDEALAAVRSGAGVSGAVAPDRRLRYSRVLYFIGGGVVFIGIVAFIAQVWEDLGSLMRVVVTLGSGLAAYVSGVLFSWHGRVGAAGPAFFLIAALVLPLGMAVALEEAGLDPERFGIQTLIALVLMAAFLGAHLLFRALSTLVWAIVSGTWAYFAFTWLLIGPNPQFDEAKIIEYQVLAGGLAFMVLAWAFSGTEREGLTGPLYAVGSAAFLGAALALGGFKPSHSVFWELAFPGLVFAILYLSVHVKSLALLTFGSLFLGAYLTKITAEYFSESLGWPLALILMGFMLMGVGYLMFRLKRSYLRE
jgi:hypothetical protein